MRNVVIKNITDKADELARLFNKTKDPKYKEEWYKLIKSEFPASLQEEEYNKILYGSGYH